MNTIILRKKFIEFAPMEIAALLQNSRKRDVTA